MNATTMDAVEVRTPRTLERVITSQRAPVGTFTVLRALPDRTRHAIGPWVFLDHFGPFRVKPGRDGVGPHPHAGIETVTYLFSGRQRHRDSAGNEGIVTALGAQWMTAGRGIVHAETPMPLQESEHDVHGIQLWTSLPRLRKQDAPRYQNLLADAIPAVERDGSITRVVGGELAGVRGPAQTLMPLVVAHVTISPSASWEAALPDDFEAGAYVVAGEATVAAHGIVSRGQLAVFTAGRGPVSIENAGTQPLEVMLIGGTPAEGPLVFHGPFVMNSVDQVRAAEIAYRTGRMGELAP